MHLLGYMADEATKAKQISRSAIETHIWDCHAMHSGKTGRSAQSNFAGDRHSHTDRLYKNQTEISNEQIDEQLTLKK